MVEELVYVGLGNLFAGVGVFFLLLFICVLLDRATTSRKSQNYRKLVTDMYVAAKARFLAKEDNLDLDKEEETFKAWLKKTKVKENVYDLDKTIEEELKERVSEPTKKGK